MIVFRILGVWSLLAAMFALTVDATKSLAGGDVWISTALGQTWYYLNSTSLNAAQAAVERHVYPWLWDPVIASLLQVPTWVFFAALGLLLYWLGRRRSQQSVYGN